MELVNIANDFDLTYLDIFTIFQNISNMKKLGYTDKKLISLGYKSLSIKKDKYVVECMATMKTFKYIELFNLKFTKYDIVKCARKFAKLLN